jgi:indole-3-glycerol phosphate synthase
MNWRIASLEVGELGLLVVALWVPFRMGRAGIRNLWAVLAGWFVLAGLMLCLVSISMLGVNGVDTDLVHALPEGPHAMLALLFGWVPAMAMAALGRKKSVKKNILDQIVEEKRLEIAKLPARIIAAGDLRDAMLERGERRDFIGALRAATHNTQHATRLALIAEVKKASPSAGIICKDFDPVRIAKEYETAGATCLSVLTDEKFFMGSLDYLRQIREAVKLPLLRKDFIIDERQILEAIEWGADAILLIVAILDDARLKKFHSLATAAGLAVLVEVHDEAELERAQAIGAELIGVNNRDLKTFKVDLGTTERLAAKLFSGTGVSPVRTQKETHRQDARATMLVAESGIHTRADVERLAKCGAGAILVGESLVKGGDIRTKIKELLRG